MPEFGNVAWATNGWLSSPSQWSKTHISEGTRWVTLCGVSFADKEWTEAMGYGTCSKCLAEREKIWSAWLAASKAAAAAAVTEPAATETSEPEYAPPACAACGARLEYDALGACLHCGATP